MGRKRKVAGTVADPTLPHVPLVIQGKEYFLCFDLGALAEAKHYFALKGHKINLLVALAELDVDNLMVLFPCALHKHHPEISFEDAQKLISFPVLYALSGAVAEAWAQSMPKPTKEAPNANPPQS
jgi:hypothetical protein